MGNKLKTHKTLKLPSKKTMNLYQVEITDNSWQRVIPYAMLIIVVEMCIRDSHTSAKGQNIRSERNRD